MNGIARLVLQSITVTLRNTRVAFYRKKRLIDKKGQRT